MAASTITRATWTNDSGTPTVPVGDGTVLNNTRLQNDIYAKIDEMFAGAGTYATLTVGGLFAATGFGAHVFSSGGVGINQITIANTSAGVGNFGRLQVTADTSNGFLDVFSASYTTLGSSIASGTRLIGNSAGGLALVAGNASGTIKFYAADALTERMRLTAGQLDLGDTTDAKITIGMCINQGAAVDSIMTFKQNGVAHAMTGGVSSYTAAETDTFGLIATAGGVGGGLAISGFSETVTTGYPVFQLTAAAPTGSGDTTKSNTAMGFFQFLATQYSAGAFGAMAANQNIATFTSGALVRQILDSDGDSHQDVGTAWTNFDEHDDVALLTALSGAVSRKEDPLRLSFSTWLGQHRDTLVANRIVTINDHDGGDGSVFINWSRTHMLLIGAVRQLGGQVADLKARLLALEA